MKHVEYLANGLGGPSMLMLAWACERRIPATISITGDTGSETDRLLSTGERIPASDYFDRFVEPLARDAGIEAHFVRAHDREGTPLPALVDLVRANAGTKRQLHVPLFGSNGGRLRQTCTDRWKMVAIRQTLRVLGATSACGAQGIHYDEAARRVKGEYIGPRDGFDIYRSPTGRRHRATGRAVTSTWLTHYYPFVDRRMNRERIAEELATRGIPYLVTSECDMCPHQDLARWDRHSPESIAATCALEDAFAGEYFFTDLRIPLRDALLRWRERRDSQPGLFQADDTDFGCESGGLCGV